MPDKNMLAGSRVKMMGPDLDRRAAAAEGADIESRIYEVPLNTWRDVASPKLGYTDFLIAAFDLLTLRVRYR